MKVVYTESIKFKVESRINKMRAKVFLYSELTDLGEIRQINRALKRLVNEQKIARMSKGVYAKLRPSLIDGKSTLDGSFDIIAQDILNKLRVPWQQDELEEQYRLRETTQLPMRPKTYVNARVNRKIQWQDKVFKYESKTKRV